MRKEINSVLLHGEPVQHVKLFTEVFGKVHFHAIDAHEDQIAFNMPMNMFVSFTFFRTGCLIDDKDIAKIKGIDLFSNNESLNELILVLYNVKYCGYCIDDLFALRRKILV